MIIDPRLRYPDGQKLPSEHTSFFENTIQKPYGDHMLQIIPMPMNGSHAGGHLQLIGVKAPLNAGASIVSNPFQTRVMHRIHSRHVTTKMIENEIAPEIARRLGDMLDESTGTPLIETHFNPHTGKDAAPIGMSPANSNVRIMRTLGKDGSPCIVVRVESRADEQQGQELCHLAENMSAKDFATSRAVKWAKEYQMRVAQRVLDECVKTIESHIGNGATLAHRKVDLAAKVGAYEQAPKVSQHNGPWSVGSTVHYMPPQFSTSDIPNDPRTTGIVIASPNCSGEAGISAMLEGNLTDPLFEFHGKEEVHPTQRKVGGSLHYRSPQKIQNNMFGAVPSFQPYLSKTDRSKIVATYENYPATREEIDNQIISVGGSSDHAHYFSRFRVPTGDEIASLVSPMSKRAFGLSGEFTRHDPIISIVP